MGLAQMLIHSAENRRIKFHNLLKKHLASYYIHTNFNSEESPFLISPVTNSAMLDVYFLLKFLLFFFHFTSILKTAIS